MISLLVPVYNEADTIAAFLAAADKVKNEIYEIIIIDDGSSDETLSVLKQTISTAEMTVKVISLLTNTDKDRAVLEGLQHVESEFVAIMDVDLQFPFSEMLRMKKVLLEKEADIVIGLKKNYSSRWNRIFRLFAAISFTKMFTNNISDFIVGRSSIVKQGLLRYMGSHTFSLKGVLYDLSPKTEFVKISIRERTQGTSKMHVWKLLNVFTSTFLLAFPNVVRISFLWSLIFGSFALVYSIRIVYTKFTNGSPAGFPSLMITQLIGFTFVFLFIGILGEYINAVMKQTILKKPFVHVKEFLHNKKLTSANPKASKNNFDVNQDSNSEIKKRGACIWLTGLPCSGKTTIANLLVMRLMERGVRTSLMDGDIIRVHLSHDLGFNPEDRNRNAKRVGFIASEIVKHSGIAVCALISPYRSTREEMRRMVGEGNFIEVFVDAPVEVCEQRDIKGHYARARRGEIQQFTGVDAPYEPPMAPDAHLRTDVVKPDEAVQIVITLLEEKGFIPRG